MAVTYKSVQVEIDPSMMRTLKGSEYCLCFAKSMGDKVYNTVWQCYGPADYLMYNTFSWTPRYQVFGTNNRLKNATTNTLNIALGQTCLLDEIGILKLIDKPGPADSLTIQNEYENIRIGVNQQNTGISGISEYTPTFINPEGLIKGTLCLRPTEELLVWFEQNTHTGDNIKKASSKSYEADLSNKAEISLFFSASGEWELKH